MNYQSNTPSQDLAIINMNMSKSFKAGDTNNNSTFDPEDLSIESAMALLDRKWGKDSVYQQIRSKLKAYIQTKINARKRLETRRNIRHPLASDEMWNLVTPYSKVLAKRNLIPNNVKPVAKHLTPEEQEIKFGQKNVNLIERQRNEYRNQLKTLKEGTQDYLRVKGLLDQVEEQKKNSENPARAFKGDRGQVVANESVAQRQSRLTTEYNDLTKDLSDAKVNFANLKGRIQNGVDQIKYLESLRFTNKFTPERNQELSDLYKRITDLAQNLSSSWAVAKEKVERYRTVTSALGEYAQDEQRKQIDFGFGTRVIQDIGKLFSGLETLVTKGDPREIQAKWNRVTYDFSKLPTYVASLPKLLIRKTSDAYSFALNDEKIDPSIYNDRWVRLSQQLGEMAPYVIPYVGPVLGGASLLSLADSFANDPIGTWNGVVDSFNPFSSQVIDSETGQLRRTLPEDRIIRGLNIILLADGAVRLKGKVNLKGLASALHEKFPVAIGDAMAFINTLDIQLKSRGIDTLAMKWLATEAKNAGFKSTQEYIAKYPNALTRIKSVIAKSPNILDNLGLKSQVNHLLSNKANVEKIRNAEKRIQGNSKKQTTAFAEPISGERTNLQVSPGARDGGAKVKVGDPSTIKSVRKTVWEPKSDAGGNGGSAKQFGGTKGSPTGPTAGVGTLTKPTGTGQLAGPETAVAQTGGARMTIPGAGTTKGPTYFLGGYEPGNGSFSKANAVQNKNVSLLDGKGEFHFAKEDLPKGYGESWTKPHGTTPFKDVHFGEDGIGFLDENGQKHLLGDIVSGNRPVPGQTMGAPGGGLFPDLSFGAAIRPPGQQVAGQSSFSFPPPSGFGSGTNSGVVRDPSDQAPPTKPATTGKPNVVRLKDGSLVDVQGSSTFPYVQFKPSDDKSLSISDPGQLPLGPPSLSPLGTEVPPGQKQDGNWNPVKIGPPVTDPVETNVQGINDAEPAKGYIFDISHPGWQQRTLTRIRQIEADLRRGFYYDSTAKMMRDYAEMLKRSLSTGMPLNEIREEYSDQEVEKNINEYRKKMGFEQLPLGWRMTQSDLLGDLIASSKSASPVEHDGYEQVIRKIIDYRNKGLVDPFTSAIFGTNAQGAKAPIDDDSDDPFFLYLKDDNSTSNTIKRESQVPDDKYFVDLSKKRNVSLRALLRWAKLDVKFANRVLQKYKAGLAAEIHGAELSTPIDVAAAAQVMRSPSEERFTWVFMKGNKVILAQTYSSRQVGNTPFIDIDPRNEGAGEAKQKVMALLAKAAALGADSISFIHNHPTGYPEPSESDISLTKNLSDLVHEFNSKYSGKQTMGLAVRDHIITNHNHYGVIPANDPDNWNVHEYEFSAIDPTLNTKANINKMESDAQFPIGLIDSNVGESRGVTRSQNIAALAKQLESANCATVFYLSHNDRVNLVAPVRLEDIVNYLCGDPTAKTLEFLARMDNATGGRMVLHLQPAQIADLAALGLSRGIKDVESGLRNLVSKGYIRSVIVGERNWFPNLRQDLRPPAKSFKIPDN